MKKKYLANALSALRPALAVLICCVVVRAIISQEVLPPWLVVVWAVIALSDGLDGIVARSDYFGKTGNGETIDELCDKIAINVVMAALCFYGAISWYFFAVMLGRDIFVTVVRSLSRRAGITAVNGARFPGKAKTCLQFLLIFVALYPITWPGGTYEIAIFVVSALAMGMSLVSGMQILLLAMDAKDPSWLEGTNGAIGAPNWCSLTRIALSAVIPYMIGAQPFGDASNVVAVVILAITIATDKLDGSLARLLCKFTKAGKALDPLSDKVLFYPVAIAMFIATGGTLLTPYADTPSVGLIMWMSIGLTVLRDLAVAIWYAIDYKKLPKGISANFWDKARMVVMCVWLGAMALAMCTQGLPIGTALRWIAYISLILVGTLSITSGAVSIERLRQINGELKEGGSE